MNSYFNSIQNPSLQKEFLEKETYTKYNNGIFWIPCYINFTNNTGLAASFTLKNLDGTNLELKTNDIVLISTGILTNNTGADNIQLGLSTTVDGTVTTSLIANQPTANWLECESGYSDTLVTLAKGLFVTARISPLLTAGSLQCNLMVWRR